ncbi:MAG TPA: small ribosomal subunit Rsm22 family protein, partial [Kofleriaceae bacterium]
MIWVVPLELEQAVLAAAHDVLGAAPLSAAALHRAVVDRSERYTSERDRLARPADRAGDLAARAAFFTIADAIKIQIPLAELRSRNALPAASPLRVVDVGAGCGALGLGLAAAGLAFRYHALDRDDQALAIAAKAMRAFAPACEVATTGCDVTKQALPAADLIVIGTLLNELPADKRLPLVERALAAIADDGGVIILEPALRDTTRALHELRDALLARGAAHVFAPCTRRGAPCPALADPDDWCHEDRLVKLPPHTAELARVTHLRDGNLKFSYLVLRKQPAPLVEAGGAAWRVVSAPHAPKGKLELLGCSDAGRVPIRLLKRHRNDQTKSLERARRGNVLVI